MEEDGKTGWVVMHALTRALQQEMGIAALSDAFGPTTISTLQARFQRIDAGWVPSANFCRVIQSALYCKGYDGGEIDGICNERVQTAVAVLKSHMGVTTAHAGSALEPEVMKGLFNMDPYVVVADGSTLVRSIQQWLNGRYISRRDFYIMACDGRHHSRDVAESMLGRSIPVLHRRASDGRAPAARVGRVAPGRRDTWRWSWSDSPIPATRAPPACPHHRAEESLTEWRSRKCSSSMRGGEPTCMTM